MKKRSLTLLLTLALGAASAQSAPSGSATSTDTRLSKSNVTFTIKRDGTGLMALLTAIAKSAGYELILDPALDSLVLPSVGAGSGVPSTDPAQGSAAPVNPNSTLLTYDFKGKPFNQVWPFLMDVYGLNYEVVRLGSQDVLRVGRNPIQKIIALPKALDATLVEQRVKLAFGTRQTTSQSQGTTAAAGSQTNSASTTTTVSDIVLDSPTLKIVGEPTSNSLIVRGSNQEVMQVEALVKQIIASQPPELAKTVVTISPTVQYIYNVKGVQADAATVLRDQYPAITVTSVGQTGQLVLSGQQSQINAALDLLGKVDKPVQAQSGPDLQQLIYTAKGKPEDVTSLVAAQFPALKVTPVGQTGQLVLSGQQSQINAALDLLGKVDKPVQAQSGPDLQQLIYTAKGKPEDVTSLVAAQFPALKVTPVGQTGQLVLSGPKPQLDAALELLGRVDKPVQAQNGPDLQQLIYTAKGKPEDIVTLFTAQFPALKATPVGASSQLILSGPKPQLDAALDLLGKVDKAAPVQAAPVPEVQQQQVYTAKGDPKDVASLLAAQFPALKVTPVGTTEQLIVSGPKSQLDTALALLKQVDRAPSVQANPAVRQQVYAVKGDQKDIAALLAAQFPGLKITPVGTTSQLVLNGTQEQLTAALDLLGSVDKPVASGPSVQQRVFQLVNASAEELKAVLDNTLQTALSAQASDTAAAPATVPVSGVDASGNPTVVSVPNPAATASPASTTAAAAPTQNPNAATIIADKRTNTLIVRGTAAQVEQVAALIPSLDQVVPQINVQVRIQEITEDAARTLGLNWKVGFGGFNISTGATGLAASFDPTRALVGGFNLLPTLNALETQTQTKRIYDGSITMQSGQRSLGTAGGSGTTNASSTAAASIKSGGRLELNIPSTSGNITKQIDYGINLDFFDPQVAPDGTITLRVRGQVNQPKTAITGTSVPNILDFSNSEAQSIVTFKSGQTLLLSGLLGTNETSTNRGVPFLSSLPVVGPAFGQKETTKTQSQLMVVITGTVVK